MPTVQVSGAYTVNVPLLLDAMSGDSRLNYNNLSSIWTGDISPDGGYAQERMIGRQDGLMVYVQQLAPTTTQPVQMIINGIDVSLRYGDSSGWEYTERGRAVGAASVSSVGDVGRRAASGRDMAPGICL